MRFWHSPGLRAPPNTTRVFGVDLAIFQSTNYCGARRPRNTMDGKKLVPKTLHTHSNQGYLVLRIFQNRDLLKVNTQDGRCGFLTAPEPTRKLSIKGFSTNSVRLGNRTYRLGAFSICEKKHKKN